MGGCGRQRWAAWSCSGHCDLRPATRWPLLCCSAVNTDTDCPPPLLQAGYRLCWRHRCPLPAMSSLAPSLTRSPSQPVSSLLHARQSASSPSLARSLPQAVEALRWGTALQRRPTRAPRTRRGRPSSRRACAWTAAGVAQRSARFASAWAAWAWACTTLTAYTNHHYAAHIA